MDIENMFSENTPLNYVKTWLCGGTEGQTYTLTNEVVFPFDPNKIEEQGYDYDWCGIVETFDDIVGFKHDYKIDDPNLGEIAHDILTGLARLREDCYKNPAKYFNKKTEDGKKEDKSYLGKIGMSDSHVMAEDANRINNMSSVLTQDAVMRIADVLAEDIARDISESADEDWNDDDFRLAFSRVVLGKLKIEE